MFTINDTVIITEGALKNAEGVIKKLGNKEYFVELSILGKKVTQWLVERSLVKKDNNLLNNWEQRNDDMIIKDINGNTVAHIMYIENNENYDYQNLFDLNNQLFTEFIAKRIEYIEDNGGQNINVDIQNKISLSFEKQVLS